MLASYVLSRTLVPTLVMMLMDHSPDPAGTRPSLLQSDVYQAFRCPGSRNCVPGYTVILAAALVSNRRPCCAESFLIFCLLSCALVLVLGRDFFPTVDAGQIRLHMRACHPARASRRTARVADEVEARSSARIVPARGVAGHLARQPRPADQRHQQCRTATAGTFAQPGWRDPGLSQRGSSIPRQRVHRSRSVASFPSSFRASEFFFQPADMVTQILNFGHCPAAVDMHVHGRQSCASITTLRRRQ